ncbi:MAG: hypothetical protein NTW29_04335 [Bacteroidetes bacterium]|nr:hypothetical protein [Bacteroidota bacterium]
MKKLVMLAMGLVIAKALFSQPPADPFERLLSSAKEVYQSSFLKNPSYFEALLNVSKFTLQPLNPAFNPAIEAQRRNTEPIDSTIDRVIDSVLNRVIAEDFWKGQEVALIKYKPAFELFTKAYCDCYTENALKDLSSPDIQQEMKKIDVVCSEKITRDVALMSKLGAEFKKLSQAEQRDMQSQVNKYLFEHCGIFRQTLMPVIVQEAYTSINTHSRLTIFDMPDNLFGCYERGKIDSLRMYFPGWNKATELSVKKALAIRKKSEEMIIPKTADKSQPDVIVLEQTFYTKGEKPVLTGQFLITINKTSKLAPYIQSVIFYTADKIPNKKELLDKINDQSSEIIEAPPPPREELKKRN